MSVSRRDPDARSGEDFLNDLSVHIGKAEVTPLASKGQLLVIKTEEVQNRGVQVMDVNGILHRVEAEVVRRPVDMTGFYPASRKPHGEGV